MLHSIIAWDCTFRNMFHLIDALLAQDYPRDRWELVYVEQRTKAYASGYNRALGLPALWDRCKALKGKANVRAVYLGDPWREPYHVGRCCNAGIEAAQGEVVSVMDGDQLLPADFLHVLGRFHEDNTRGIACLARHMAARPAGASFARWTDASFELVDVLAVCPYGRDPYPVNRKPGGYLPLLSARREFWEAAGGFDPHPVWSTSATCAGLDAAKRLELATGSGAETLLGAFSAHPWHPVGYARKHRTAGDEQVRAFLDLQAGLADAATEPDWSARTPAADAVYEINRELVEAVLDDERNELRAAYRAAKKKAK